MASLNFPCREAPKTAIKKPRGKGLWTSFCFGQKAFDMDFFLKKNVVLLDFG
jgi:hypothetical protein